MADTGDNNDNSGAMETEDDKTSKDYYFDSYSHFGIHEEMLKDYVRTNTYKKSMVDNKHLFEGKVVLDVGCGTGILCMFAAESGAKQVYGVDSASIVNCARQIVKENGWEDKIQIIHGKIEEIDLPVEQVDIIISEWMGYFLVYESMVDSVLFARDKWLAPGGILMPDKARLHICGIEDASYRREKLDYWNDVYGYKMSCIKKMAEVEPLVDIVPPNQVISNSAVIREFDLYTLTVADMDFNSEFEIEWKRQEFCHGLVCWFDVQFSKCHTPLGFTTAPFAEYTHWKQTVFYVEDPIRAEPDQKLTGQIFVQKNEHNPRDINIKLTHTTHYDHTQTREYAMR